MSSGARGLDTDLGPRSSVRDGCSNWATNFRVEARGGQQRASAEDGPFPSFPTAEDASGRSPTRTMTTLVPHYNPGTMGELVVQVLRDAGEGGLTVAEIIEAAKQAGRRFPNENAQISGVRSVLDPGGFPRTNKLRANTYFKRMDEGAYTNFVEQRWTLRFDRLDLTGVNPTRWVPGVSPQLDARRDYKYVGSKVLRKTRDGRSVRGVVSAYDPTLKFDSYEPNGYKVMYDDGRSEWLQEGLLLEILVPEPTLAPPTKRPAPETAAPARAARTRCVSRTVGARRSSRSPQAGSESRQST